MELLASQPQAVFSGPTAGFHTNDTTDVTVTVISAVPTRDFRFAIPHTDEVLPHLCPDVDCPVGPSHLFPSLTAGSSFNLGTFVGPTQVALGIIVCRPEQFTQSCPPTGNVVLLFSSVETGVYRFGVEAVDAFDFNDMVFEFHATPKPHTEQLVVGVFPSQSTVSPPSTECFNGVAQIWYHVSVDALGTRRCSLALRHDSLPREDTTTVLVRAVYLPSHRAAAGAGLALVATPVDTGGGHHHNVVARPGGTLLAPGENVNGPGRPAGRDSTFSIQLDANGEAHVMYRSSGIGGRETVRATVQAAGVTVTDSCMVDVAVPGLQELQASATLGLIGGGPAAPKHPSNSWVTAGMSASLSALADTLAGIGAENAALPAVDRPAGRFPSVLQVNDASLPRGGVFDLHFDWQPSHQGHKGGFEADVDVRGDSGDDNYAFVVRQVWIVQRGHSMYDERASRNHVHLIL